MKRLFILALLCVFSASGAFAQMRVELSFDQEHFLPNEELLAKVRVYNSSGQTLVLGKEIDWLTFNVEAKDGSIVPIRKNPDVVGEFTLPSAHRATKSVDLAEAFELVKFGRYTVTAMVKVAGWGESFASKSKVFDISTGVKLWEQAFGIPAERQGGRPEIRKYVLTQANHVKQLNLYLRITDESENYTYKIFPIGGVISFSKPEPQVDRYSNLHILYQDGARTFLYTAITPDGLQLSRQTWIYTESRPQLVARNGRVEVKGGARRVSASDLPPPELLSEKTSAPVPARSEAAKVVDGKSSNK
jgi:hypothetical protein